MTPLPSSASLPRPKRASIARAVALMIALLLPLAGMADPPSSPFPGLEVVSSKNVDLLYRRPDVDFSAYDKIMIGEPMVEFSKNWNPRNYGKFGLTAVQLNEDSRRSCRNGQERVREGAG